jgi:predicted DNA-binding WGR domain protein
MPRFEFSEGTSNKFWEITLDDASFTTVWGKIGTSGQSTTKTFDSASKAKLEFDKLVAGKVNGYQLVDATTTAAGTATAKVARREAAPAPVTARAARGRGCGHA